MGRMMGYGVCLWRDGTQYQGMWKNCIKEGQGKLVYADNSCVTGEFKDDQPEGKCTKTFNDGSVYKGMMAAGLFHG